MSGPQESIPPAAPAGRPRLGRNVVALAVVSGLTDVSSEMISPLLPGFLRQTLGASATFIGALEGAAEATSSLLKLASGWWSDRLPRRKPLVVAGYALASLARPLVALARTAGEVLAVRITDRVGKGLRTSPRDALIADSVDPSSRGRAFGIHRAGDHAGAVLGPLVAFALLQGAGLPLRTVFLWSAVPAALSVLILVAFVREPPRVREPVAAAPDLQLGMGGRFWSFLAVVLLFTLGNASDAFLLLRAADLGVTAAQLPLLWAALHVVKSASSVRGGGMSDRLGRRPLIVAGWILYGLVYLALGWATQAWHAWALFCAYGVQSGLTEGAQKALVADVVPAARRGAAFGWFHLTVGLGALPASLVFGAVWDAAGAAAAFTYGGVLALVAAAGMAIVLPRTATSSS